MASFSPISSIASRLALPSQLFESNTARLREGALATRYGVHGDVHMLNFMIYLLPDPHAARPSQSLRLRPMSPRLGRHQPSLPPRDGPTSNPAY
jgi:hypothetical protein